MELSAAPALLIPKWIAAAAAAESDKTQNSRPTGREFCITLSARSRRSDRHPPPFWRPGAAPARSRQPVAALLTEDNRLRSAITAPCGGSRPIGKRTRRAKRVPSTNTNCQLFLHFSISNNLFFIIQYYLKYLQKRDIIIVLHILIYPYKGEYYFGKNVFSLPLLWVDV